MSFSCLSSGCVYILLLKCVSFSLVCLHLSLLSCARKQDSGSFSTTCPPDPQKACTPQATLNTHPWVTSPTTEPTPTTGWVSKCIADKSFPWLHERLRGSAGNSVRGQDFPRPRANDCKPLETWVEHVCCCWKHQEMETQSCCRVWSFKRCSAFRPRSLVCIWVRSALLGSQSWR